MARLLLFSVYDNKAHLWSPPFTAITAGAAIRDFQDSVNDPKTRLWQHPEDYCLYGIGTFLDDTGEVLPLVEHQNLGLASKYKVESTPPLLENIER